MLNIEEILAITNEMGVELRDSTDGKHYILNEDGKEIEFNINMLMKADEQSTSYKIKFQLSVDGNDSKLNSNYNLTNSKSSYVSKPVAINQSITNAA